MKKKKIMALFLAVLTALQFLPVFSANAENAEYSFVPEGYTYYGDCYTDEFGETIYYVCKSAGESGVEVGYWVDEYGNRVENEAAEAIAATTEDTALDSVVFDVDRENSPYPSSYDARELGYVTGSEYQVGGTCWAMATIAAIETNAIKNGYADSSLDLSEYHAVWTGSNGYFAGVDDSLNDGYIASNTTSVITAGGTPTKMGYALLNFAGAVKESNYPITSTSTSSLVNELTNKTTFENKYLRDITVTDIISVQSKESAIKQALLDYGGVYVSFASVSGKAYDYVNGDTKVRTYYTGTASVSGYHAVEIIGWDDNLPLEYFGQSQKPGSCGAWLCKNSYGDNWGVMGPYFWLSYEERTINSVTAFKTASNDEYQDIFHYDGVGYSTSISAQKAANIFTAEKDTRLTKVSLGGPALKSNYTLKIIKLNDNYTDPADGTVVYTQNGNFAGRKTVDIYGDVYLDAGDKFAVLFENITVCYAEGKNSAQKGYTSHAGESYYYSNGVWYDSTLKTDDSGVKMYNNLCIRAVGSKVSEKDSYTVEFVCGSNRIKKTSVNGTVDLPETEGYTWVCIYNGEEFDGTGVNSDMVVSAHCYQTSGKVSSSSGCVTEFRCLYCSQEMKPAIKNHSTYNTVKNPTAESMGYTTTKCHNCSFVGYNTYTAVAGAQTGECGKIHWQYKDGVLAINGEGTLSVDYSGADSWRDYKNLAETVYVNNHITEIGAHAFDGFSATEVYLESGIDYIDDYAFANMLNFEYIEFSDDLYYIGDYAFRGCTSLTEITMPTDLEDMGTLIFFDCTALEKIVFPSGFYEIYSNVYGTTDSTKWSLKEVFISSSVSYISGDFASELYKIEKVTIAPTSPYFKMYDGLLFNPSKTSLYSYPANNTAEYYNVPDTVTYISPYAFSNNPYLKYLEMSCGVKSLSANSIRNCSALEHITFPTTLQYLYQNAVTGCGTVKSVFIPSTIKTLNAKWITQSGGAPEIYTDKESTVISSYVSSANTQCHTDHASHSYTVILKNNGTCNTKSEKILGCVCGNTQCSLCTMEHCFTGECVDNGSSTHVTKCIYCDTYSEPEQCDMEFIESTTGKNCNTSGVDRYVCTKCGAVEERNNGKYGSHKYSLFSCKICGASRFSLFTRIREMLSRFFGR